jgi:undecaprenyl-diphosphatase
LPVSSTGHLILVGHFLGQTAEAHKAFDVVIQFGAILAVLVHYRALLLARLVGLFRRDRASARLLLALSLGFLPAAIVGLTLHGVIKRHLFGPVPVALALALGGVLMIVVEKWRARSPGVQADSLEAITPKVALMIGLGQCFSLWPGASRSMCTIVAGQLSGLSTRTAAEFSFLLALPTLGAATLYEGLKSRQELLADLGATPILVGLLVSFLVAWAVVATFLHFLTRYGLAPFGYYRIALALVVLAVTWS